MKFEDLLAMEVPTKQLKTICAEFKIKPGGNSSDDYAKSIASEPKSHDKANEVLNEFRYAGRTTARLYKPIELQERFNNISSFKGFLIEKYSDIIFGRGNILTPSKEPKLWKAQEYKGKIYLTFIYLGRERRIFKDFDVHKYQAEEVDFLVVHFNPLLLEVRVPMIQDEPFKKAFLKVVNINNDIEWVNLSCLNDSEAKQLRSVCNSILTSAKHKMTEGAFDSVEVKAKPDINLDKEKEYLNSYCDKPFNNLRIQFPFKYSPTFEEKITMVVSKEGVNFFSQVSEDVIQYVVDHILQIKNQPSVSEAAAGSE